MLCGLFFSCSEQASHCGRFSCCGAWALGPTGFSNCSSWALERWLNSCGAVTKQQQNGLSCSVACGIFLDQSSNPCLLPWQVDSLPLRHWANPHFFFFFRLVFKVPTVAPENLCLRQEGERRGGQTFSTSHPPGNFLYVLSSRTLSHGHF